jgi:hypothetical protein
MVCCCVGGVVIFWGLFFVGSVNFRAVIFSGWLVFCVMLFLWCDGFWWFFGLGMVSIFGAVVFGVWFLFRFCWFLCFWMLWAVVFILGRWLVWWFGFCGVFGFLSSFAS